MNKPHITKVDLFRTMKRVSASALCATMLLTPVTPAFAVNDRTAQNVISDTQVSDTQAQVPLIKLQPATPIDSSVADEEEKVDGTADGQSSAPPASDSAESSDESKPSTPDELVPPKEVAPLTKLEPAQQPVSEATKEEIPASTKRIPVNKATPMTNLALDVQEITSSADGNQPGSGIANKALLTDGDKYYLNHDADGNKTNNNKWEDYLEKGAVLNSKSGWIQVDLGASYPIEVINLKREVYHGQSTQREGDIWGRKHYRLQGDVNTYEKTAIVVGNKSDLSDGEVVYYQEGAELPQGVEIPAEASEPYEEAMGGQWFYMNPDHDGGLGATKLGETKKARYIWVYSENPNQDQVSFMELGVYGYQSEEDIETYWKRRVINNENPMLMGTAYSSDSYTLGQQEEPGLQGYNTVSGRCKAIPDEIRGNYTMLLHSNNLRSFSPDHISQAYLQAYMEHGLQICYENDTSAMLLGITGSSAPGGEPWFILQDLDYGWLDLMYRMYPNMEGTFNTEDFWSGNLSSVAKNSAIQLEMAHKYGGNFIWSDQDHGGYIGNMFKYKELQDALLNYGDSCYMIYKNTNGGPEDLTTHSYLQGAWLAGYTGGWGMLSDTWFWSNKGFGKLYERAPNGIEGWQKLCGVPEALIGSQMISTYLGGGVIYTFEFPEIVYGTMDKNSPAFTHVVSKLFKHFKDNPAPDRKQILSETKLFLHGRVQSDFYSETTGAQTGASVYNTGRYGVIPVALPIESRDVFTKRIHGAAEEMQMRRAPYVIGTDSSVLSGDVAKKYFQTLYQKEYDGNAFADRLYDFNRGDVWYVYNSTLNTKTNQTARLPLRGGKGANIKAEIEPHTFFYLDEDEENNNIKLHVNNYRVNKDHWVFDNPNGWSWSGSSASGEGVSPGKLSVYNYMSIYNVVDADPNKVVIDGKTEHSPEDNELRRTTFVLSKLAKAPEIKLVDAQKPDTDRKPQYEEPTVVFDAQTGIATITITSNGWGDYEITGLEYLPDDSFQLEADAPIGGKEGNLALGAKVTYSKATSPDRVNHMVDGVKSLNGNGNYSDPGGNAGGAHWAQIDFGREQEVREVKMWRYWNGSRQYKDTVVMLSNDPDFPAEKSLVLWNSNKDSNRTWLGNGNGQAEGHKLPEGNNDLYTETEQGKTFPVVGEAVQWLSGSKENLPQGNDFFKARYVRVYMNGGINNGTAFNSNHIVELEVNGISTDIILEELDTEAPTTPKGLKVDSYTDSVVKVSFEEAWDDLGISGYEVIYKQKDTAIQSTVFTTSTSAVIEGLYPKTMYEISVVAVDVAGNKSEASDRVRIVTDRLPSDSSGGGSGSSHKDKPDKDSEAKSDGTITETNKGSDGTTSTTVKDKNGEIIKITVKIPDSAAGGKVVTLPIEVSAGASPQKAPVICVDVPIGGAVVEIPVKGVSAGTVVIIVDPNGGESIEKHSVITDKGVKLRLSADADIKVVDNSKHFTDASESDWFSQAVRFVTAREIMNGVGENTFAPSASLSRGMMAVLLHNLENNPAGVQNISFSDVSADSWYGSAITWAAEKNILAGYGDKRIGPNDPITREQLAVILYRYIGSPQSESELEGFTDSAQVSVYAKQAMTWCIKNGIMSGKGNRTLDPKGKATRGETAQMLMQFLRIQ